jgi:hypothetical protein
MDLQVKSIRANRQRLENLNASLPIHRLLSIKRRDSRHVCRTHTSDEVDHILRSLLESEIDGESRESSKLGMKFEQEVSLSLFDANGIGLELGQ